MLPSGGWVVVYPASEDGFSTELWTRIFGADGTPLGDAQPVTPVGVNSSDAIALTILDSGAWVAAWLDGGALKQRAFGPDGSALTDVQTVVALTQTFSITALQDNRWVVTWDADLFSDTPQVIHHTFGFNNDAPSGTNGTITLTQGGMHHFAARDFGFADSNGDGLAAVVISGLPTAGLLTLDGVAVVAGQRVAVRDPGDLVWTAPRGRYGDDLGSLRFRVVDEGGTAHGGIDTDATANTQSLAVSRQTQPPSGTTRTIDVTEDQACTLTADALGFGDVDGDDLAGVTLISLPLRGSLTLNGEIVVIGQEIALGDLAGLSWTPPKDAIGASVASLTFRLRDDGGTVNGGLDSDTMIRELTFDVGDVVDVFRGTLVRDSMAGTVGAVRFNARAGADGVRGFGGNDTAYGGAGDDTLRGGGGADTLFGGGGNDRLGGGKGDDRLVGGRGADLFVFRPGSGDDTIADFGTNDRIDLRRFDGITALANLQDHLRQVGDDVVLRFGADRLVLENLRQGALEAADFLF